MNMIVPQNKGSDILKMAITGNRVSVVAIYLGPTRACDSTFLHCSAHLCIFAFTHINTKFKIGITNIICLQTIEKVPHTDYRFSVFCIRGYISRDR